MLWFLLERVPKGLEVSSYPFPHFQHIYSGVSLGSSGRQVLGSNMGEPGTDRTLPPGWHTGYTLRGWGAGVHVYVCACGLMGRARYWQIRYNRNQWKRGKDLTRNCWAQTATGLMTSGTLRDPGSRPTDLCLCVSWSQIFWRSLSGLSLL